MKDTRQMDMFSDVYDIDSRERLPLKGFVVVYDGSIFSGYVKGIWTRDGFDLNRKIMAKVSDGTKSLTLEFVTERWEATDKHSGGGGTKGFNVIESGKVGTTAEEWQWYVDYIETYPAGNFRFWKQHEVEAWNKLKEEAKKWIN